MFEIGNNMNKGEAEEALFICYLKLWKCEWPPEEFRLVFNLKRSDQQFLCPPWNHSRISFSSSTADRETDGGLTKVCLTMFKTTSSESGVLWGLSRSRCTTCSSNTLTLSISLLVARIPGNCTAHRTNLFVFYSKQTWLSLAWLLVQALTAQQVPELSKDFTYFRKGCSCQGATMVSHWAN